MKTIKKNVLNKILRIFLPALAIITVCGSVIKPKQANADEFNEKKLQYFELDNPIAVCRNEDEVYIAEKNKIIVYRSDTYRTLNLDAAFEKSYNVRKSFNVAALDKCGNALLVLNGDGAEKELFVVDLTTLTLAAEPFLTSSVDSASSGEYASTLKNVSAISALGDEFIACVNENGTKKIRFFRYEADSGSTYTEFKPSYVSNTINGDKIPSSIAYVENDGSSKATYYSAAEVLRITSNRSIEEITNLKPQTVFYSDGLLYMRTKSADGSDMISTLSASDNHNAKHILSLSENGLAGAQGFYVFNKKMLICDTENDRIIEFDLSGDKAQKTDFEISFTKIDLPGNFSFGHNDSPEYITIADNTDLYNVNLTETFEKGYFVYGGMYNAGGEGSSEYLVLGTVVSGGNEYYLVLGNCTALVMKEDYIPSALTLETPEKTELVLANDSHIYKTVYKTAEKSLTEGYDSELDAKFFYEFTDKVERGTEVTVLKEYTLRGIKFAYISCNKGEGYIPLSCLTEKPQPAKEKTNFKTATTAKKTISVYSDKELKNKTDELPAYSEILIYSSEDGVYYISYGEDKFGYIAQTAVAKKSTYVIKVVAVVILFALSVCLAAIFFENKYLYRKNK